MGRCSAIRCRAARHCQHHCNTTDADGRMRTSASVRLFVIHIAFRNPCRNRLRCRHASCDDNNGTMPVLNDEVPDEGDFDAGRRPRRIRRHHARGFHPRGPVTAIRRGWLGPADISRARRQLPIAYVEIVPDAHRRPGQGLPDRLACCAFRTTGPSSAR